MSIDIAACVGELLYEHESVIVPQLGGFMASYRAASIDHVQGILQPPSKGLNFNDNLVVNDGRLLEYVAKKYSLDRPSAEEEINKFVEKTKLALHQREIVNFPGVGRLYLDFEKKHKFLQDQNNFNTDSFGLPAVQFYPIYRNQEVKTVAAAKQIPTPTASAVAVANIRPQRPASSSTTKVNRFSDWMQPFMFGVVALALGVIILSVIIIKREMGPATSINTGEPIPVNRVNQSPIKAGGDPLLEDDEPALLNPLEEASELDEEVALDDTDGATLSPETLVATVIIGVFKNNRNVESLMKEIQQAGFTPYSEKQGAAFRVGAQYAYQTEEEFNRKLQRIKTSFSNDAWVLEP